VAKFSTVIDDGVGIVGGIVGIIGGIFWMHTLKQKRTENKINIENAKMEQALFILDGEIKTEELRRLKNKHQKNK
jgi:hypothetical protein